MDNYKQQATDFLEKTGTTIANEFIKNDFHFENDKDKRDIYLIIIKRGDRSFSFHFGQSLVNSGFYAKQGVKITPIDRKYLELSNDAIWSKYWNFGLMPKVSNDKIHRPKEPNRYDILACLTKYDVGTLENFCNEFGYDIDSKIAEKVYKAVCEEYSNVQRIWNDDEIKQLQEIN